MACNKPIAAFQEIGGGAITFKETPNTRRLKLPCGQCWGCRLEKSRVWGMRCVHEASLHEKNCFVTLTYKDEELPEHGGLRKIHLQNFFKRLKERFPKDRVWSDRKKAYENKSPIRYFACGEYGDITARAHYHACIFGADFDDKIPFRRIGEHTLYISDKLNEIWGHGNTSIGELTFQSAAYTARYCMKKRLGKGGRRYEHHNEETGEITALEQPFAIMSLRPAIAERWLRRYHGDIYGAHKDSLTMRGVTMKPARYYDKIYDTINPIRMEEIKQQRITNAEPKTDQQLNARESKHRARYETRKQI